MAVTRRLHNIKETFPQILKECLGIVTTACKKAGIERRTYYDWRKADILFAEACDEANEHTIDFVESKLHSLINAENPAAVIFYMKTKAKHRGYIERIESTGKDGGPIQTETLDAPQKKLFERALRNVEDTAIARHDAELGATNGNHRVV